MSLTKPGTSDAFLKPHLTSLLSRDTNSNIEQISINCWHPPFLPEKAARTLKSLDLYFKSKSLIKFRSCCEDYDMMHSPHCVCHSILTCTALYHSFISPIVLFSIFICHRRSEIVFLFLAFSQPQLYGRFQSLFQFLLLQGHVLVVAINALTSPEPHLIPEEDEGQDGEQKRG